MNSSVEALISVIVPIYNAEVYIDNCVNSLLNQTYKKIEIILVDDGSQDNSYEICEKLEERDNRIVFVSKVNGGASSARNRGLDEAKGEFITFVDVDDYVEETFVQTMYEMIMQYNTDIAICKPIKQYTDGTIIENKKYPEISWYNGEGLLKFLRLEFNIDWGAIWNKLFKAEIIKKYKLRYDETIKYGEDYLFVGSYLANTYSGCITDKIEYHYVYSSDSVSNKYNTTKKFDVELLSWIKSGEELKKYCDSPDLNKAYNSYISYRYQDVLYIMVQCNYINRKFEKYILKNLRANKKYWMRTDIFSYKIKILMFIACCSLPLYKKICRLSGVKNG